MVTPIQLTATELEVTADAPVGILEVGGDTNAANECRPACAAKPTEHWLPAAQAPARVPVLVSKISIARLLPVTDESAVAVRTTVWPGIAVAVSATRCSDFGPGREEATGTSCTSAQRV